ncbi:putative disease resistance protein RGA3 [Lactuca sativa]|uniref:putative disease resistance protein RGA3 n=1 Tax=Lactuca sativa TaxID=4236 RepID=UPI000CD934BF|nr:putative disease resistance protein RGA3 [Lactuca sativa]
MGHKIKNINEKLSQINKDANDLGLQNEQPGPVVPYRPYPETDPNLGEFKIVGRGDDEGRIIHLLTESRKEEKLTIVPIVGMGGMGKTTLAQCVYNNPKIQQHFDVKAWLCVSVKVDINTLLAKIYESLAREKPKSETIVNLVSDLEEKLASKRYLLVLDDVWDEERLYWEDFRSVMINVKSQIGSSILVTTRKLNIGTKAMAMDSCPLKGLSDDYCWHIFKDRAFLPGQSPQPELEEIGRDIVKKCCGLPLLVKVIGGMLQNYIDPEKWLSIKNSKVWDLEDERDRVEKSLQLSFDNLPNSMAKQCFAYCSIFEKDTLMEREELVQLWMALGLVQADYTRGKEMEDVGNDIFQILVSNSLFQDVQRDEYGHITHCRMHDLMHDLSLSLSKHESLCHVVGAANDDMSRIYHIDHVKHLAFYKKREDDEFEAEASMFIERDMMARTLHTLFLIGLYEKNLSFQRFKCMRILKLEDYKIEKLGDSIGELVHLRYLDLLYTYITALPESIGKLYHLQTLKLPDIIEQLPESMRNLISLRYFIYEGNIPSNIVGQWILIRNLPSFIVLRRKGHGIEELRHLNNLGGKLRIGGLENVRSKEDAVKADLSRKKNLYDIEFNWTLKDEAAKRNNEDVLEGLQPPQDVKILRINNFCGDSFPDWVTKMAIHIEPKWTPLDKIVSIRLEGCRNCLSLPTLEHLPHLRDLVLREMDSLTCLRSSVVSGSTNPLSPSLRTLRLRSMKRLEKWIDGATNSSKMISPVLEKLGITHCPKIILIDECHPHPLVSLDIFDCSGLVSIKSIQGLTCLLTLKISRCDSLLGITNLPNECHSLKTLFINHCNKLTSLPHEMFDCFAFLNELRVGPFSKALDSFPSLQGIEKLRNHLHSLTLTGWDHWESVPEEIQHFTSLMRLRIVGFGIQELPMWLTNMSSIRHLLFNDCKGLNKAKVRQGAPKKANIVELDNVEC